jgi:TolB-like protein
MVIGLASALLFGKPAVAQTVSKRLAVLEFAGKIDTEVLETFADAVRGGAAEGLAGHGIDVLTRENMMVLLRGKNDCSGGDCEVETARSIGADFVVSGTVARVDDALVVTLKLQETKRGSLLASDQVNAKRQLEVLRQLRERGRIMVAKNIGTHPASAFAQAQPPAFTEPRTPAQPAWLPANGLPPVADVASRPAEPAPFQTGRIYISAYGPGRVTSGGQDRGPLPLEIPNLYPGTYRIRVELQDGTVDERDAQVVAGRVTMIFIESPAEVVQRARHGAHFGFEVGAGPWVSISPSHTGPYGSAGLFLDIGLDREVDVRVGLRGQFGDLDSSFAFLVGIPVSLRLNIGSVYAIVLGVNTGVRWTDQGIGYYRPNDLGMFMGPEVSLLNFRFGQKRDFELAVVQGYAASITSAHAGASYTSASHGANIFYNTFVFSMLW